MAQQSSHTSIHYSSTKPATDVKIENIIHYLCDRGPGYCKRCPSQCAYGKRFLREFAGGKQGNKQEVKSYNLMVDLQ